MTIPEIPPLDNAVMQSAENRQNILTKPTGALGQLETISIRLAGMTGKAQPWFSRKGVIVMAGDHGVTKEGVSAYPSAVTAQMVLNFLGGGAAVNVLARQAGATVTVVDMGVNFDFEPHELLIDKKIGYGTRNMANEPAMSREEAERAIVAGMEVISTEIANGLDIVAIGEMGIGNTTAASAITAVLTGKGVIDVTGRGTGIGNDALTKKMRTIRAAIQINEVDRTDPLDILHKVGGYEIAGLVGVVLGAASRRVPIITDGFIATAAVAIAAELAPNVKNYLLASHNSVEIGHQLLLARLDLEPLFDFGMRLGEGSGAVLAFHIVEAAVRTLNEMATFESAGVDDKG